MSPAPSVCGGVRGATGARGTPSNPDLFVHSRQDRTSSSRATPMGVGDLRESQGLTTPRLQIAGDTLLVGPYLAQELCLPRAWPGALGPAATLSPEALLCSRNVQELQMHTNAALPFLLPCRNTALTFSLLQARAVPGQRGCQVAPQLSWGSALGSRSSSKRSAAQCLG